MQFSYPLRDSDGKEINEESVFYNALATQNKGFFPIDADGLWHQGVSFTHGNGQIAMDGKVVAIADGEIVAYRIPRQNRTINIDDQSNCEYSNAFTLVRHVYETPRGNILVFFSSYANLLPYGAYAGKALPEYILGDKSYYVGQQAHDTGEFANGEVGIRVRLKPAGDVIGIMPRGSLLILKGDNSYWKQLETIQQGQPRIRPGWVWTPELDNIGNGRYRVGNKAVDTESFAGNTRGLRMRIEARQDVIALLPRGVTVTLSNERDGNWAKIVAIIAGQPVIYPGWIFQPELDEQISPSGSVVYRVSKRAADFENEILPATQGLRIRLTANGAVMGLLTHGSEMILGERQGNWSKVISHTKNAPHYKHGWVWLSELDAPKDRARIYTVGKKANDRPDFADGVSGLNMRLEPAGILFGLLPKKARVELGGTQNNWAQVKSLDFGEAIYDKGWVWVPELDHDSGSIYIVGSKAADREEDFAPGEVGIRMRHMLSREVIGLLPRGSKIELEAHANQWAKIRSVVSGSPRYKPAWVWVPELDPPGEINKRYQAVEHAQDSPEFANGLRGLNIRHEPNGIVFGLLPYGVQIELDGQSGNWAQIDKIAKGEAVFDLGWVWVPELDHIGGLRYRVGNLAADVEAGFAPGEVGIRMRHMLSREVLGLIPRGAEIELEAHSYTWAKIKSVHVKDALYRRGWVWSGELAEVKEQGQGYVVGDKASDLMPKFAGSAIGIRLRTEPGGDIMGLIPRGVELELEPAQGSWARVKNFIKGDAIYEHGWVYTPDMDELTQAHNDADIIITSQAVKAGELIGYAAKYQDVADQHEHKLDINVFSADDVPHFISNPYADTGGKELLLLPENSALYDQVESGAGAGFEDSGMRTAVKVVIDADEATLEKDKAGNEWLEITSFTTDAAEITGWIRKDSASKQTSLQWPGFEIIDIERQLLAQYRNYQPLLQVFASENPAVTPPLAADIVVAANQAQQKMIQLGRQIIYGRSDYRDAQDALAYLERRVAYLSEQTALNENIDQLEQIHAAEKQRLQDGQWWPQVEDKIRNFPQGGIAYHFHPISLVRNFASLPDKYILTDIPSLITLQMLQSVHKGNDLYYREILPYINIYAHKYKVNTNVRIAHFLSQIGHESSFIIRDESLKYSVSRMQQIFGNGGRRSKLYSNPGYYAYFYNDATIPGNDVHLGNYVYADRLGNGSEASGDGFRYHGRGMIQLTGKTNYLQYTQHHNQYSPEDPQDFVAQPELVVDNKRYGVESAFVWWDRNGMNVIADKVQPASSSKSAVDGNIKVVTKRVNGGYNGLTDRTNNFWSIWKLLA